MNVYLDRIRQNIRTVMAGLAPGTKVCMIMKADGYGCGAEEVARGVESLCDFFAVSTTSEAMELRAAGIHQPILILGYTWPEDYEEMIRMGIRINIYREEDVVLLSEVARYLGKEAYVHFSLNTGMNRLGFSDSEQAADTIARIAKLPGIVPEGLFTHFAKADAADTAEAYSQFARFAAFKKQLEQRGLSIPICHAANSAGAMAMPDTAMNMVRLGIVAYGFYPSDEMKHELVIRPGMELKSRVIHVQTVPAGQGIGYGYSYVTEQETCIATVSVGYADGYSRLLSNVGDVLIHGKRAAIRGRVCMDQMMVDVSTIPGVQIGDEVTLIGRDGDEEITLEELQEKSGLLTYEIICGLSHRRVPKIYINEKDK